ncbi:hypothetical protein [Nucisporomicrobium flavum]|nr:hypothetical protein [Nucisporomicrobium flavum]
MGGEQEVRRAGRKPSLPWRTAGEVALLAVKIMAAVAALYGALKGGGLA